VPIYNVLQTNFDDDLFKELIPKLKDRIWIVATKAVGLLDVKPNPLDPIAPGGELPASLISESIVGSRGVQEVDILLYCLIASLGFLLWIVLLVLVEPQRPGLLYMIGSSTTVIFPLVTSLLAWLAFTAWFDPVPLVFGLFVTITLHFVYKVRRDWRERLQFAKAIQHSMSPQMLKLIEQGHVEVRRYGEKQDVFIMFSDLIGFTTMSEQVSPEMLVKLMNFYLDEAVKLIIGHSGYVDKFIGDAIMAIWGAPVRGSGSLEFNADSALKVAMSFNSVTELCRRTWEKQYGLVLPLGVRSGIHYGDAIVGNFGSHDRFNYTALGDTVNLASRLEGVGKYYNQLITVSGEVVSKASPKLASEFFLVDEVVVKGKEKSTKIYTTSQRADERAVNKYKSAFEAYRAEKWDDALRGFKDAELAGIGAAKTLRMRSEELRLGRGLEKFENGIWKLDEK
jgi:adenylate cyclase